MRKNSPLLDIVLKSYKTRGCFLDLGCGTGSNALFMAEQGFQVVAVDKSVEALEKFKQAANARDLDKRIEFVRKDVRDYVIGPGKFDIIGLFNILQMLPPDDARNLISEAKSKVKKSGYIIISAFSVDDPGGNRENNFRLKSQELLEVFSGFKIIHCFEGMVQDAPHEGNIKPHKHGVARLIAYKL